MELRRSEKHPEWFMTYSIWADEDALNTYRDSALFAEVWKNVKPLFSAKAEALSAIEGDADSIQKTKAFKASGEPWKCVWRKEI